MLQRKIGEVGLTRFDTSSEMRKVSTVRESSDQPKRKETVTEYDKKSVGSMGPSLVGFLASKRFARKLTSRVAGSWGNRSRVSNVESTYPKEPTYRMEPKSKFCPGTVRDIIKSKVTERLEGFHYNPKQAALLSKVLTEEIKEKLKSLNYERYKLICQVTIGENTGQCMMVTSRCSWDPMSDTSATFTHNTPTWFCTTTVFGIYNE